MQLNLIIKVGGGLVMLEDELYTFWEQLDSMVKSYGVLKILKKKFWPG